MIRYSNLSGDSGVVSYEIETDSIVIEFDSGMRYVYNHLKPGRAQVEEMKRLAVSGRGLNSYIVRRVGKNFYRKF